MSNQREKFGSRLLNNEEDVFSQNAWDNVELDEDQIRMSEEKIRENSERKMPADESAKYDQQANEYWNEFYAVHSDKFFKERNWIFIDFPELIGNCSEAQKQVTFEREFQDKLRLVDGAESAGQKPNENAAKKPGESTKSEDISGEEKSADEKELRIFEIGCGTGSTIRTILNVNTNPKTTVYCCDFSSNAIDILKASKPLDPIRTFSELGSLLFANNKRCIKSAVVFNDTGNERFKSKTKPENFYLKPPESVGAEFSLLFNPLKPICLFTITNFPLVFNHNLRSQSPFT